VTKLVASPDGVAAALGPRANGARTQSGTSRPRLLFLCQTLPFPPDGGVTIRSFNVLRLLSKEFDVTALCFYRKRSRRNAAEVQDSIAGLSGFAKVEAFPIPQEHNRARFVYDHMKSVVTGRAYTAYAYGSSDYERRVRELVDSGTFDLVHMDSLDLSAYLPLLAGLPVVCTHHNVESALLLRRAKIEGSGLSAAYLRHQAKLTEKEERSWCSRVDLNLAVSENDRAELQALSPKAHFAVVPNGVDTAQFTPAPSSGSGLVFVGGYDWFPNRDAMQFFVEDIQPVLRESGVVAQLTWVGFAPDDVRADFGPRFGAQLTGYVPDVRPYVQNAGCYIVPLRVGGGTRLKILDAWAMGKAVVSTSVGCEGLDAKDGVNILIRDTAAGFAEAVSQVLTDERLRSRLGCAARQTAVSVYDWSVIGETFLSEYKELATSSYEKSRL
jgi:glycosyltransferase involved in cell wall biosynthesis